MKKIQLSQGLVALVDDEDYKKVKSLTWQIHKDKNNVYVCSRGWRKGEQKRIWLHRLIMNTPENLLGSLTSGM